MATQTTHFDMVKQQSAEHVSVGLLNDNFDIIDQVMYDNQEKSEQLADEYNAGTTYNVGDYVRRENYIYKCNTASTTGVWDSTKWDRVKITEELGGGGGSSTLAGLNDVNISSPTDGQALIFDNATQKWVNRAGGGGSSTFAGLNDVSVAGVANKDIARYNSSTQKWEKSSALTDLELAVSQISASTLGITNGHHILKADGTQMAQEEDLQFIGVNVADDNANGKTIVTSAIECTQAQYDAWKLAGTLLTDVDYYIIDASPLAIITEGTPTVGTNVTLKRGKWQKIGNIIYVTALVTVGSTLGANAPILGNLPRAADDNVNVGIVNPPWNGTNTTPLTARMYQTALYTNKAGELTANTDYAIMAQYTVASS